MLKLRVGYEFIYRFPQPTPCLLVLHVHHSRIGDLHNHIKFDYAKALPTRTASEGYTKRVGVLPRLRPSGDRVLPCNRYSCTRKQTRVHLIQSPHRRGQ